jgi:predicted patatin/cPLA2 family phospholipase
MMIGKDELILLDGGMLHQVPVDAAISLGANYLIIVLSGEDTRAPSDPASWNLYQFTCNVNRISMFGSQAMDYLGREKAKSFLIAPREKKISQIDYNGAYYKGEFVTIEDYMQEGYRDAQGKGNGFREISAGEFVSK